MQTLIFFSKTILCLVSSEHKPYEIVSLFKVTFWHLFSCSWLGVVLLYFVVELVLFPDFWVSNIRRYFCFAWYGTLVSTNKITVWWSMTTESCVYTDDTDYFMGCSGWQRAGHKCYTFYDRPRSNWQAARSQCQQLGADLLRVDSLDERVCQLCISGITNAQ